MSVATFTDTMADITLEYNDREIYNDVRSQTSDTEGFEEAYSTKTIRPNRCDYPPQIGAGVTQQITVHPDSGDTEITWLEITDVSAVGETITEISQAECSTLGGTWKNVLGGMCTFGSMTEYLTVEEIERTDYSFTFEVTNNHPYLTLRWRIEIAYRYLSERTILVRSTDDTSIQKYGRRVMNLVWPLGQSIEQTQSLVDGYLERHKEPVPLLTVRIQGSTDDLVTQILTRKISDRITINHTILGIADDFFINSINPSHDSEGLLEAIWHLEQVRPSEEPSIFILDSSELDGSDILG
jgi:hypothetical protein